MNLSFVHYIIIYKYREDDYIVKKIKNYLKVGLFLNKYNTSKQIYHYTVEFIYE